MQVEFLAMSHNYIQVGGSILGHKNGNLAHAQYWTNCNTPPICDASLSLAQHNSLYNQARQPLPQLYYGGSRKFRKNSKNIRYTLSPDLSMKSLPPSSAKI